MSSFLKSKAKILSYIFVIITLGSPAVCISDVVYAPDYSWRLDSSTGITVALKGKPKTKWLSDNITKTTTYTYADKTTFTVSQTVQPTISKSIKGLVQTTTITFGNKKKKTIKETGVLIAGSESMSADLLSKNATYRFSNGDNIVIPTTLKGAPKVKWGSDNITKYTVFTYSDKSTYSTVSRVEPTTSTSWSNDHLVKTIIYKFANGKKSKIREKIQPVSEVTYADDVQLTILKFGDGYVEQTSKKATNISTTWGSDNVTKTTTYTFATGEKHSVVAVVPGTESAPTYSGNTQTIVITFGNGQTSTIKNTATATAITWASDNVTKTTTYTFANGGNNSVVATVPPFASTPVLTPAAYPSNWTTSGTVSNPSVSSLTNTFGNGVVSILENGTPSLPFNQSTLTTLSITDPSAVVRSSTTDYNLTWGTPDKRGPTASNLFRDSGISLTLNQPQIIAGYIVEGICGLYACGGPTYKTPSVDVLQAWDQGWTGKGSKILIIDSFGKNKAQSQSDDFHGIYVSVLAGYTAIGSEILTYDNSFTGKIGNAFGTPDLSGSLSAINMSFDFTYDTDLVRTNARTIVSGISTNSHFFISGIQNNDAVLVKAAGNDTKSIANKGNMTALSVALIEDSTAISKTLLVGALDRDGSVGNRANLASYSNIPGSDSKFSDRFILANGTSPFARDFAWDLNYDPGNEVGTSFAAPRIAGYIGILRQKFPNLDAVKTSSIILDTARYDTLTCHPNCDPTIYGKGEASLSRALAPVGRLR